MDKYGKGSCGERVAGKKKLMGKGKGYRK